MSRRAVCPAVVTIDGGEGLTVKEHIVNGGCLADAEGLHVYILQGRTSKEHATHIGYMVCMKGRQV